MSRSSKHLAGVPVSIHTLPDMFHTGTKDVDISYRPPRSIYPLDMRNKRMSLLLGFLDVSITKRNYKRVHRVTRLARSQGDTHTRRPFSPFSSWCTPMPIDIANDCSPSPHLLPPYLNVPVKFLPPLVSCLLLFLSIYNRLVLFTLFSGDTSFSSLGAGIPPYLVGDDGYTSDYDEWTILERMK